MSSSLPGCGGEKKKKTGGKQPKSGAGPKAAELPNRRRGWYRLIALLVVPAIFLVVEGTLRVTGFGYPTHFLLHQKLNGRELIHENQQFGWRFFPPASARTPRPVILPAKKPAGTRRIFVFGESAAYGDPSPAFGMPRFFEVLLRDRYPESSFEVVNAAMTAINSNVILPMARDCASEEGDFWILYIGNNEVVGPYGAGTVFGPQVPGLGFIRASIAFKATKIGQAISSVGSGLSQGKASELSTVGLNLFLEHKLRPEDPRMAKVYEHFAKNLADIVETGKRAGAKVIASTVASNLKDCPPFVSLHRANLSDSDKAKWEELYQSGIKSETAGDLPAALNAYDQASRIDDQFAELHFRQGNAFWRSGDFESARKHYEKARDLDGLRVRADGRINEIIREVTNLEQNREVVQFVNGQEILARASAHGIPGEEVLFEHVHLNVRGNYLLARALAEQIGALMPGTGTTTERHKESGKAWLTEEQASERLGLNDWERWRTWELLCKRLSGAPFTAQLNHLAQYERFKSEATRYRAAADQGGAATAMDACKRAISLAPNDWVLHRNFAEFLTERGDRRSATAEWRKVTELLPHNASAIYELGLSCERDGRPKEALEELTMAAGLNANSPEALSALGRVLASNGRYSEAIQRGKQALRLRRNDPDALVAMGMGLAGQGKTAEAKARFEEALRLKPGHQTATLELGKLLNASGQLNALVQQYTDSLRQNPDDPDLHEKLGGTLEAMGRFTEAKSHYADAVRLRPNSAEAHYQLGLILTREGNTVEAMRHLSEAVRLDPDSFHARLNLGVALAKEQRFAEATDQFQEALRLKPNDPTAQKYLAASLKALGKQPTH